MSATEISPPPTETVKEERRRSAFLVLRHRDFRLLWLGQLISVTGSQMQLVAINWHVWILTKSPLALGLVGLVRILPIIFCSLAGGVTADVFNRKKSMLVTQSTMLISAGILAWITASGHVAVWSIYLLTAIASAAVAFDNPARQALLPALVPKEEFPNAVSLGLVVFNLAMIIGPALGGLLLAPPGPRLASLMKHSPLLTSMQGPALVYALNAASFLAVILALLMMRTAGRPIHEESQASKVSLSALRDGLRFVWRTPIIVQTMTLDFVATFFASATALLPIFADEILHVGARGLGMLASAPAVGSVITGLVMARMGTIRKQGLVVINSIAVYGATTIAFGLSRYFYFSLAMLALMGAADTVSTVLRQTIRQLVTPDYLRGRMTSINMVFFMGGPQLGEMEAGTVAALIGAPLSVITGGIGCILAVIIAYAMAGTLKHYEWRH